MGMKPRAKPWKQLATNVVIGACEAEAIALGGRELEGVALHDAEEVIRFGFQYALDAWTSDNGTTYVSSWRSDPLFCWSDGVWRLVAMEFPDTAGHTRITRVVGLSGATPHDDELYCVAEPYTIHGPHQCTLLRRHAGVWREISVPAGRPWELARGIGSDVMLSVGGETPVLLRVNADDVAPVELPAQAAGYRVFGVCATSDGALLVMLSAPGAQTSTPWLLRDGTWSQVASEQTLQGWAIGFIDSVTWRGDTYVCTDAGVFCLDGDRLVRQSQFTARSVWPIGDALVAVGFRDGSYAHEINRGEGWQPLHIPEPAVVFGGRGKLVWLPPKRKLPCRRVRMKKPAKPVLVVPSVDDYCKRWLEERVFRGRGQPRQPALSVADDMRAHNGADISDQLAQYLDLYSRNQVELRFGELGMWPPEYFAPPLAEPTPIELATFTFYQQPCIIAALTGSLYIGADHGGQVYFVDTAADSSAVFVYGPGLGAMSFLADSLDAFMFLNDLAEQWSDYGRTNDMDYEDVERGDVDTSAPEIKQITAGLTSLATRVNLDEDAAVTSEFHELLPWLTGVRPVSTSASAVGPLFERAHWLVMVLCDIYVDVSAALGRDFDTDLAEPTLGALPATRVYWLWHLYLFDDPRLAAFAASVSEHPSSLVRGTAALMTELVGATPDSAFDALTKVRDKVREARANAAS